MANDNSIRLSGIVIDTLPNTMFRVKLDNGLEILSKLSGKLKIRHIKVLKGDTVEIELSPYDLTKGRIVYRHITKKK